jgi:hypothetical protein
VLSQQCDVIAGPVAPTVAWKLGEKTDDPVANYLADIFTLPASLAGLPWHERCRWVLGRQGGMPVGMQLIGNYLRRGARCCNVAHRFQLHTDSPHAKHPAGCSMSAATHWSTATKSSSASRPTPNLPRSSKIFSRASTAFGAEPNTQACAVDLALARYAAGDRTAPRWNALSSSAWRWVRTLRRAAMFARKNYFYPDLPKGYQISQFEIPGGARRRGVDSTWAMRRKPCAWCVPTWKRTPASRCTKTLSARSGIDLNRAGTPLLEIVTEPDMRSQRRGGGLRRRAARDRDLDWHLRRQHARGQLPLRRQRVGAQARRTAGHAARDQEPEQLQVHAAGHRL